VLPLFVVASYEWLWERKRWQQSSSVKFHKDVCILWIQNCEVQTLYFIFVYLLRYWKFDNKNIFMPQEQELIKTAILKVILHL
jgi:hypothetical protein